ncbi:SAM-dependent methyltransferase [Hahella chejuensis KCTC 2396]|uniref:Thiopurine S-methyltransferase n=1 Tax=Hahella chejuensis (strain KCTC 2396) TaxID=349521 RepID=Q2SMC8_HAHCH|nr:thiopurine S-methyltransferase [Hahella chejuensis]ABC28196.1 SAM-dependent methyltransferase [Hahella chejuensis KCTC 2396]
MDANFWHERWAENSIAFHQCEANPLLVAHFNRLDLAKGSRVFVPLCGKTLDISWLLSQGHRVVGCELSEMAIEQFFKELGVTPAISEIVAGKRYSAENLDIIVGDFFDLTVETLGHVDATYDRAALVALPKPMRDSYAKHLMALTNNAPQLMLCYQYDQTQMEGPPFSISAEEVQHHYADSYALTALATVGVEGGLRELNEVSETVWLLESR